MAMAAIMVVDDEPMILETVAGVLAEDGHTVLTARDGVAARDLLAGRVPDLVVTDPMMPRLDGPGLVRWMRSHPELRHTPAVMTSAAASPTLTGLEPVFLLAKPFDLNTFLALVARAIT